MNNPYLIQRLGPARSATPFDFGGGLKNGGLSDEAMAGLSRIFSFDYMGAAEFEFGAVPKALQTLAEYSLKHELTMITVHDIYIICPKDITIDVTKWINLARVNKHPSTKEYVGLKGAINKENRATYRIRGWLKIESENRCEHPFMFFIDEEMFNNCCYLFHLKKRKDVKEE